MTFSFPRATVGALAEEARQAGYTGIELRIGRSHGHGLEIDTPVAARKEAVRIAADAGVELYSLAASHTLAVDPLDEADARSTLALAADLGSRVIRVFGGAFADSGLPFADARARLVAGLARFGELAREETGADGVRIALESHDAWTDPAELAAVLDEVGRANVGLNWDAYHIVRMTGQGVAAHFPAIAKHVTHVHFHDGQATNEAPVLAPIGTGIVDHAELLRSLASISFDGYLMGEWIHSMMEGITDPVVYLPRELRRLKSIEAAL